VTAFANNNKAAMGFENWLGLGRFPNPWFPNPNATYPTNCKLATVVAVLIWTTEYDLRIQKQ